MPLSEFYRMVKGKIDPLQHKQTDVSYIPDDEFVELVLEKGQIMMQGQSSKGRKAPVSSNFQYHTLKFQEKEIASAATSKMGKFGAMDSILNVPMSGEMSLNQDDDMVTWLNYPFNDNTFEHDYYSELLPEISGVTVNEPSSHTSFTPITKDSHSHNVSVHHSASLEQVNTSKAMSSKNGHLFPWSLHQVQIPSNPSLRSGVSEIVSSNTRNPPHVISGDSTYIKMQKQDPGLPCSSSSNLLNFSHFSRPAAMARASLQNNGAVADSGSSGIERMGSNDKQSNAPSDIDPTCGSEKEMWFHSQSSLVAGKADSSPLLTKPLEESRSVEQSNVVPQEDAIDNDKKTMEPKGVQDTEKTMEPIGASSSVCSGNSAERASNDPTKSLKRKSPDTEDFECQSEDVEEESVRVKKAPSSRGGTGSKRSRAAEVHNLSERRRRDRINEKMRALQELIPNCNKVDKASMLDEAIEYLKTLQLQVQIMSMGTGLCMPPMMFSTGMQMHAAHVPHFSPMGVGMGMGMGYGMGMVDLNGGLQGHPMIPLPPMQGSRYPSPPPISGFQGIPGSNLHQVYGHPPGQGVPMLFPQVPVSGRSPINPAVRLNASRMGAHVEVPNAAAPSSQMMHNADASSSMTQTSSQFQPTNEGFDQFSLVVKKDQAPEVGCSTTVSTISSSRAAGCE